LLDSTPVVNFINILQAAFAPIFLCQKIAKPNCNEKKAAQNTLVQKVENKMLMKLTPVWNKSFHAKKFKV